MPALFKSVGGAIQSNSNLAMVAGESLVQGDRVFFSGDGKVYKLPTAMSSVFSLTDSINNGGMDGPAFGAKRIDYRRMLVIYPVTGPDLKIAIVTLDGNTLAQNGTTQTTSTNMHISAGGGFDIDMVSDTKALVCWRGILSRYYSVHVTISGDDVTAISSEVDVDSSSQNVDQHIHVVHMFDEFAICTNVSSTDIRVYRVDTSGATPSFSAAATTLKGMNDGPNVFKINANLAMWTFQNIRGLIKVDASNLAIDAGLAVISSRSAILVLDDKGFIFSVGKTSNFRASASVNIDRLDGVVDRSRTYTTIKDAGANQLRWAHPRNCRGKIDAIRVPGTNQLLILLCPNGTSVESSLWSMDAGNSLYTGSVVNDAANLEQSAFDALQLGTPTTGLGGSLVYFEGGKAVGGWMDETGTDISFRMFPVGEVSFLCDGIVLTASAIVDDPIQVGTGIVGGFSGLESGRPVWPRTYANGVSHDPGLLSDYADPSHLLFNYKPLGLAISPTQILLRKEGSM